MQIDATYIIVFVVLLILFETFRQIVKRHRDERPIPVPVPGREFFKPFNTNWDFQGEFQEVVHVVDGDRRVAEVPEGFTHFWSDDPEIDDVQKPGWILHKDDNNGRFFELDASWLSGNHGYMIPSVPVQAGHRYLVKLVLDGRVSVNPDIVSVGTIYFNHTSGQPTRHVEHSLAPGNGEYLWLIHAPEKALVNVYGYVSFRFPGTQGKVNFRSFSIEEVPADYGTGSEIDLT